MNCTQTKLLIPLYAGGDLSSEQTEIVRKHVDSCALCRNLVAEYQESLSWLSEVTPPPLDESVFDNLRSAVHREISQSQFRPSYFDWLGLRWNPRFAFAVSVIILAFIVGFGVYTGYRHRYDTGSISDLKLGKKPSSEDPGRLRSPDLDSVHLDRTLKTVPDMKNKKRKPRLLPLAKMPRQIPLPDLDVLALNQNLKGEKNDQETIRIEIQTADPNIRIIWFAPKSDTSTDRSFNNNE